MIDNFAPILLDIVPPSILTIEPSQTLLLHLAELLSSKDVLVLLPHLSSGQALLVCFVAALVEVGGGRGVGRAAVLQKTLQLLS